MPTQVTQSYSAATALTVTNLQSLANSATAGWRSDLVDLRTVAPLDVEVFVKLTTANTAPANDKAMYVYACPFFHDGTSWLASDQGTATLPTSSEGTTTIANPNNLKLLGVLSYTTQNMTVQGSFNLSSAVGQSMPDGFSIIVINYSGAALSTACVVAYKTIAQTLT